MPANIPAFDRDDATRLMGRPEGVTARQLSEITGCDFRAASNWLCKRRHLGKAFHPGGTTGSPFFATRELMEAWAAVHRKPERTEVVRDVLLAHGEAGACTAMLAEQMGVKSYVAAGAAMRLHSRGEAQMRVYLGWHVYWTKGVEITERAFLAHCQRIDAIRQSAAAKGGATLAEKHRAKPRNYAGSGVVLAKSAKSAPVTIRNSDAGRPQGEADFSRARVTVCPSVSYDPRFQLPPGSTPFGAGFAAVGLGRSVETGRAWA